MRQEESHAQAAYGLPSFDEQMERLFHSTKARTQAELAAVLGITQPSLSDAKKRKAIPADWLVTLMQTMRVNPEWIITGMGEAYLDIARAGNQGGRGTKSRAWMISVARQLPARILANELARRIAVVEREEDR